MLLYDKKYIKSKLCKEPSFFLDLPVCDLDYDICQFIVTLDPRSVQYVPVIHLRENEGAISKIALMDNGDLIEYIPKDILSEELSLLASRNIKNKNTKLCFLQHIPLLLKNEEICVNACKVDKRNIEHTPLAFLKFIN